MITILLTEANLILRQTLSEILLWSDYQIVSASNGRAALAILQTNRCRPDVIIADLLLEPVDGIELLQSIRSHQEWRQIPIILLATPTQLAYAGLALQYEVDGYISKPFPIEDLLSSIQGAIAKHGRHDSKQQANPRTTLPRP